MSEISNFSLFEFNGIPKHFQDPTLPVKGYGYWRLHAFTIHIENHSKLLKYLLINN